MNAPKIKKKTTDKAANKAKSANIGNEEQLFTDLSSLGKNGKNIIRIEVDSRRR
jgi:hypothetical protein